MPMCACIPSHCVCLYVFELLSSHCLLARLFDLLEIWGVGITLYMLAISNSYPPKIISHDVTPQHCHMGIPIFVHTQISHSWLFYQFYPILPALYAYQYTLSQIQLTQITGVLQLNQLQIPFF